MAKQMEIYYQNSKGRVEWQCSSCGNRFEYKTNDCGSQVTIGGRIVALVCRKCLPSFCHHLLDSLNYPPVNANDVAQKGA